MPIGRRDIDMGGLEKAVVGGKGHGETRFASENLGHHAG
jgi:hypothetical protein